VTASAGTPFATAEVYRTLGWTGTLPLPPASKSPPPPGFTGHAGKWPGPDDLARWRTSGYATKVNGHLEQHIASNIALRFPPNTIGFDVDEYGDKHGGGTMRLLRDKLGELPPTVRSTSRRSGVSGIYLYRVPGGLTWPTELGPNVEIIQYGHRYAVVAPSVHDKTGLTYRWIAADGTPTKPPVPGMLPELPVAWVDYLTGTDTVNGSTRPTGHRSRAREGLKTAREWLRGLDQGEPCRWVGRVTADALAAARREDGNAYDPTRDAVLALLRTAEQGHVGVGPMLVKIRTTYVATVAADRGGAAVAEGEFDRFAESGAAKILDTPTPDLEKGCRCRPVDPPADVDLEAVTLADVLAATRKLHHVVDEGPIRFSLGVAVSSVLDEEPLWGMNVGPPSSGKTVVQELLSGVADDQVDELTVAGLLTWSKGGKRGTAARPVGLLPRVGERGFATIGDFSTILAGSDHNGRDQLFGDLRRVYDGKFSRNMDSPDGKPLRWVGRLTLLAAVTPAIDRYSSHTDALGPRWLYIRTEAASTPDKRAAAQKARRRGDAAEHRKVIRAAAAALVAEGRRVVAEVDLSDDAHNAIDDAALVACWGRASVPRQTWGRRDVDGVAVIEEPPRLVRQLVTLARCLVAIGDTEQTAVDLARRCALDTVPAARRDCLTYLSNGEEATVSDIARYTRHHRDVIRRALEDLQIVGLTSCPIREGADVDQEDPPNRTAPSPWTLNGDDGELAFTVLTDHRRAQKRAQEEA
jgi:hypothetical protein